MSNSPANTEELRAEILQIMADLSAGKISNTVARTQLIGARAAIETMRVEMEAKRLGPCFEAVSFNAADRAKPKLKRVA